jgi:multidrug efflux pump subunit AcrB
VEDQGYVVASVSLPDGASVTRTREYMAKLVPDFLVIPADKPAVSHVFAISGFDLIGGGEKFDKAPNEPSEEEIAASFAAARAIGDEDEDIIKTLPKDAPKSKMTISDEDYDKLMKFLNAKERLRNIDSALRQNKKISRGGDDMISKDSNEEERLKAKKAELEKRIDDLVASSEYLQRRKAPEDKNK